MEYLYTDFLLPIDLIFLKIQAEELEKEKEERAKNAERER